MRKAKRQMVQNNDGRRSRRYYPEAFYKDVNTETAAQLLNNHSTSQFVAETPDKVVPVKTKGCKIPVLSLHQVRA